MPPEFKHASRGELQRMEELFKKKAPVIEQFDSERWEGERNKIIDGIAEAFQTKAMSDLDTFELTCLMTRYSLKDGLALAKKTGFDGATVASLLREYGGKHELQQKIITGKPLKERLLQFLDYRRASPLSFATSEYSWVEREKRADDFLHSASYTLADQDPELELKVKTLLRQDGDRDPNRPGDKGIGRLSFDEFDEAGLAFKEKIDRLYDPFFETSHVEGAGRPRVREISPTVSEANAYLREWKDIATSKPVFFVPVQEWVFKKLFHTKVVIEGLNWPEVEVESAVVSGKKLPLREAVQEYKTAAENGEFNHDWALKQLFTEPNEDARTTIPLKELTAGLEGIGVDPTQLDAQGLIKRNAVSKLELTFKIRCREYSKTLEAERQQLQQKRAALKGRKADTANVDYTLRITRELEETFKQLAKGEMDVNALSGNSLAGADRSFTANIQERNFATAGQSKTLMETLRGFTSAETQETRPAKYDHFSRTELEEIFQQVFPTINLTELKRLRAQNMAEQDITTKAHQPQIWDAESYFDPEDASYGIDGDPKDPHPKELMKISRPVDAILVTGVYDTRDEADGAWKASRVTFDTASPPDLPRTATIFELVAKVGMALPVALHATHDQRVIGITDKGKQVPIVVAKDEMGRLIVESFPPDVRRIAYAQEVPDLLPGVTDISEQDYGTWLAKRKKEDKGRQTPEEALRLLPTDCKQFVETIRSLTPAERVRQVEQFVREIGYYDFRNGETQGERVGTSLKTRWELMRQRMKQLQNGPPKKLELSSKKIAGVCVDFQELTTALLNAVGCISGKLSALRVHNDAKATSQDAHALSYVEWPTAQGGSMRVPIDGTPGGTNPDESESLSQIQEPTQITRTQLLEAHRFEHEMEDEEINGKTKTEGKGPQSPSAPTEEREPLRKLKPAPIEEPTNEKAPPSLTRERMTEYLKTSLSAEETHALYRVVSWLAYSGVLEELAQLGDLPGTLNREGQLKMELAQVYTNGLGEALPQNQTGEPTTIVRDWEHAYHKVRASRYTPTRLADLVLDALPRATQPQSRRDRSITYLGRIL